jgi:hypothetical protein
MRNSENGIAPAGGTNRGEALRNAGPRFGSRATDLVARERYGSVNYAGWEPLGADADQPDGPRTIGAIENLTGPHTPQGARVDARDVRSEVGTARKLATVAAMGGDEGSRGPLTRRYRTSAPPRKTDLGAANRNVADGPTASM